MSLEDAMSLHQAGRLDEARAAYEAVLSADPNAAQAMALWGTVALQQGRLDDALAALQNALQIDDQLAEAWEHLGQAQRAIGEAGQAASSFRKALEVEPERGNAWAMLSLVLVETGFIDEAVQAGLAAVRCAPELGDAHTNLALAYKQAGRVDEAAVAYRNAIELDAANVFAWGGLAELGTEVEPELVERLHALLDGGGLNPYEAEVAGFALGQLREAAGSFEAAWQAYSHANRLRAGRIGPYDHAALEQRYAELKALELGGEPIGQAGAAPIFIVGFPRTGTTLVERILAQHPDVLAGGELPVIGYIVDQTGLGDPGAQELSWLQGPYTGHGQRVTDKMPHNFEHLWLISRVFPDATIVHCTRDRRDTLVSVFAQDFGTAHAYKHDLAQLRAAWEAYEALMVHWSEALPLNVHEVSYEALVSDSEAQVRALLDACGLSWDERCLDVRGGPYQPTRDASRQGGFTASRVGRYKRFEPWISPLL